jgi:hypothetical protein
MIFHNYSLVFEFFLITMLSILLHFHIVHIFAFFFLAANELFILKLNKA